MKILVLGSGAREHAIILALRAEARRAGGHAHEILCAPGNAGIAQHAALVEVDPMDGSAVRSFADEHGVDLVVIGPEAPLVAGVADVVRAHGIPVFGPGRAAAQPGGAAARRSERQRSPARRSGGGRGGGAHPECASEHP